MPQPPSPIPVELREAERRAPRYGLAAGVMAAFAAVAAMFVAAMLTGPFASF